MCCTYLDLPDMHRGSLNIQTEMLCSKLKTFKGVYKGNLEFPQGKGSNKI